MRKTVFIFTLIKLSLKSKTIMETKKRKSKGYRIVEKPNSISNFKNFEIDGKKIIGGCFPMIICFFSYCPVLKMRPPDKDEPIML